MNNPAHRTHAVQKTEKLPFKAFLKKLTLFQACCGKTRDLANYIRPRFEAVQSRTTLAIRLCLVVNQIQGNGTLDCPVCGKRMQGNGRSFKYVEQKEYLTSGRAVYVIYCILCPQQCCEHCRAAGGHYCHKILPEKTAYYLRGFSAMYEKALTGDADGEAPLSDSHCVRLARAWATRCLQRQRVVTRKIAAAAGKVQAARGFGTVTAAAEGLVRLLYGENPAKGWFCRDMNRYHLAVRFA